VPIPNFHYYIDEVFRYSVDVNNDDGKSYRTLQILEILGWAFGANPILQVSALVDGVSCPVRALTGLVRDDVMNAFPGEVHAQRSGFRATISLRDAESHTVRLQFLGCACDHHVEFSISGKQTVRPNVFHDFVSALQNVNEQHIETTCDPECLDILVKRVEGTFEGYGASDPYWSVLTDDRFRIGTIDEHLDEFFATGQDAVAFFVGALRRNGIGVDEIHTVTEVGCGVGRVTIHLADLFDQVIGVDISRAHLALARQVSARNGKVNIRYEHMSSLSIIDKLPMCDALYTVIVLQHNPPPVMRFMLDRLLKRVNPGGVAFFQVPVLTPGYSYTARKHLSRPATGLEQHVLPQREVFGLLSENGFHILEALPDCWLAPPHLSCSFLARRRLDDEGRSARA
jgi:SAM-dependent methyltransferase